MPESTVSIKVRLDFGPLVDALRKAAEGLQELADKWAEAQLPDEPEDAPGGPPPAGQEYFCATCQATHGPWTPCARPEGLQGN